MIRFPLLLFPLAERTDPESGTRFRYPLCCPQGRNKIYSIGTQSLISFELAILFRPVGTLGLDESHEEHAIDEFKNTLPACFCCFIHDIDTETTKHLGPRKDRGTGFRKTVKKLNTSSDI